MDSPDKNTPPFDIKEPERWRIILDLNLKAWSNSYKDLPDHLKDKGYKLITVYTLTLAAFPPLLIQHIELQKHLWQHSFGVIAISCSFVLFLALASIAAAIIFMIRAVIKTRPFQTFTCEEIRGHAENPNYDLYVVYQTVIQHLELITSHNLGLHSDMQKDARRSLNLYFFAVTLGFMLYLVSQLTLSLR